MAGANEAKTNLCARCGEGNGDDGDCGDCANCGQALCLHAVGAKVCPPHPLDTVSLAITPEGAGYAAQVIASGIGYATESDADRLARTRADCKASPHFALGLVTETLRIVAEAVRAGKPLGRRPEELAAWVDEQVAFVNAVTS